MRIRRVLAGIFLLVAVLGTGNPAEAQLSKLLADGIDVRMGFVGNAPDAIAGFSGSVFLRAWGGVGLYIDAKFDPDSPEDERGFDPEATPELVTALGGRYLRSEATWRSVNAAVIKGLTPLLMVYAGAGLTRRTGYALYEVSPFTGVGLGGLVWAEDRREKGGLLNVMMGIMTPLSSRFTAQLGVETQPRGFTVGLGLKLPPW